MDKEPSTSLSRLDNGNNHVSEVKKSSHTGSFSYVEWSLSSAATIWKSIVILTLTSMISIFLYGTFYYLYVPIAHLEAPLHFELNPSSSNRPMLEASARVCPQGLSELYGGQEYVVDLSVDLPESETNMQAGAFGLILVAYDDAGKTIRTSRRRAMLKYRSWTLRIIDTFFFSPLYLLGLMSQHQYRIVELDSHFQEDLFRPTKKLTVYIESTTLQIYGASLQLHAKLKGLKYWMFHWPVSTGFVCFTMLESTLAFIAFTSWLGLAFRARLREKESENSSIDSGPSVDGHSKVVSSVNDSMKGSDDKGQEHDECFGSGSADCGLKLRTNAGKVETLS